MPAITARRGQFHQPAHGSAAGEGQEGGGGVEPLVRRIARGQLAQVLEPAAHEGEDGDPAEERDIARMAVRDGMSKRPSRSRP